MPFEVVMPRLGWNMETGRLGEWLKKDGEHVEAGELLFTVESDKAVQEVEALESGTLHIPTGAPPPGEEVAGGHLVGLSCWPKGNRRLSRLRAPAEPSAPPAKAEGRTAEQRPAGGPCPGRPAERRTGHQPARTSHGAASWASTWSGLKGSGRTGRIVERDVRQAAARPALCRAHQSAGQAAGRRVGRRYRSAGGPNARQTHRARRRRSGGPGGCHPGAGRGAGRGARSGRRARAGGRQRAAYQLHAPHHRRAHGRQRPYRRPGHADHRSRRDRAGAAAQSAQERWGTAGTFLQRSAGEAQRPGAAGTPGGQRPFRGREQPRPGRHGQHRHRGRHRARAAGAGAARRASQEPAPDRARVIGPDRTDAGGARRTG